MRVPLYQQLYDSLVADIRSGQLKSGDRVLSEKELASKFRVSPITSKKALEKLHQDQFIRRVRGKGSFVAAQLPASANTAAKDPAPASPPATPHGLLAIILPDFDSSYGLQTVRAAEVQCAEFGYHLILKSTHGDALAETHAIRSCMQLGVQGLLILPVHGEYYNADILRLVLDGFPLVLVDRSIKGIPACTVSIDNSKAATQLTERLLADDADSIVFLSPPVENTSAIQERLQGFTAAVTKRGVPSHHVHYLSNLYSTLPNAFYGENIRRDEETLRAFFVQHPDVHTIMACEYNLAVLAEKVLTQLNRSIPAPYQIGCFDSPHHAADLPQFTHIQQDEAAMGRAAVELLVAQLRHTPHSKHTSIDFQLIEGRSTRARNRAEISA